MRRRQFIQLISDLRSELVRSVDPAVNPSDLPTLKRKLSRIYETLYDEYDWPFLNITTERMTLNEGQRYYDFPDNIDFDKLDEEPAIWWNGQPHRIIRGIGFEQYATYDSENDDQSDPVQRWDVKYTDPVAQLEVWPVPASSSQAIQFKGKLKFAPLVDDADLCELDDHIVIGFAAAELLPKDSNVQLVMSGIQQRLSRVKGRSKTASPRVRLGLGQVNPPISGKSVVRVSG